jgi:hypothetical protein
MSFVLICVIVFLLLSVGLKVRRVRRGGSFFWMSKSGRDS